MAVCSCAAAPHTPADPTHQLPVVHAAQHAPWPPGQDACPPQPTVTRHRGKVRALTVLKLPRRTLCWNPMRSTFHCPKGRCALAFSSPFVLHRNETAEVRSGSMSSIQSEIFAGASMYPVSARVPHLDTMHIRRAFAKPCRDKLSVLRRYTARREKN